MKGELKRKIGVGFRFWWFPEGGYLGQGWVILVYYLYLLNSELFVQKKLGHRRVKDGEVTYKKFETTQLMGSIQLGIQNSVGNLTAQVQRQAGRAAFLEGTVGKIRSWSAITK